MCIYIYIIYMYVLAWTCAYPCTEFLGRDHVETLKICSLFDCLSYVFCLVSWVPEMCFSVRGKNRGPSCLHVMDLCVSRHRMCVCVCWNRSRAGLEVLFFCSWSFIWALYRTGHCIHIPCIWRAKISPKYQNKCLSDPSKMEPKSTPGPGGTLPGSSWG